MKLLVLLFLSTIAWGSVGKDTVLVYPKIFTSDPPTVATVYHACIKHGIKYPDIVTAQSVLETGYYKSDLCKQNNNLFGLYNSNRREYYKFNTWEESILGYKNLVEYKFADTLDLSKENYLKFLENLPYAMDQDYIKKVKTILYRHFPTD